MKRFITTALVCLSVVAVAAAPCLAANNSGPAKKTTGDITFINTGYPADFGQVSARWVFNAIEASANSPVKGSAFYEDKFGSYTATVTSVSVNGQDATFSARVTVDNYDYASVGDVFTWTVHDRAEPGVGNDYFTYLYSGGSIDLPVITAGNIQVHA